MNFTTTLADYLNEVKRKLHITTTEDNTEWSNSLLIDLVNDARLWFWNKAGYVMRDGVVYKTSVASTESYSIAGLNIKRIKSVRYNNGTSKRNLKYMSLQDYNVLNETAESGDPFAWTIEKSTLKVFPSPSTAVTNGIEIYCDKTLSRLSDSDSDSDFTDETDSDIETDYRHIIVRYVVGLSWMEAEQEARASGHFAMAERMYSESAFEINSETIGENVSHETSVYIDETDERHYGTLA